MLLGFEHVGMTSANLNRTIDFYCGLLGLTLALRKRNNRGEVAFLDTGTGMLEVICPSAPIARARDIDQHQAGIRHLTLAYEDIDVIVKRLVTAGVEIIEHPRKAIYLEMLHRVAFVRDPDGIVVELVERNEDR